MHILQHVDQPVVAFQRQHAIRRTAMDVQIDISNAAMRIIREMPGQIKRDRGRAHPTPNSDEGNGFPRPRQRDRVDSGIALAHIDGALEYLYGKRLDQIIAHTQPQQAAEQPNVVTLAQRNYLYRGLAHLGKARQIGQRHPGALQIDQQDQWRSSDLRQVPDCVVDTADRDVDVRHCLIQNEALQHLFRHTFANERHKIGGSRSGLASLE
jgi:hypothetical protein